MPRKYKFKVGETILCFHGPLIYEAKCLQAVKTNDGSVIYLIHYIGWNKKWDEWINEDQVLRYNKKNLNKQAKAKMAYMAQTSIRKPRSKKSDNLEHYTSKQDNQDVDQASCSGVSDKLCDQPDAAEESEPSTSKKGVKEQEQQTSANSSSTDISDNDDSEGDGNKSEITSEKDVNEVEENYSASSSSSDEPDMVCEEEHAYVDRTPEKDVNEREENDSASSSSSDDPDMVCEEEHAYVDHTPEKDVNEEGPNNSASSSSSDAPVKELQEPLLDKIEIRIELPKELKDYLVDDWDLVCRQKKLVILPEKHNLTKIFTSYIDYKCETCPSVNWRNGAGREMLLGLETYFTTVLNTQLLYNIERPQYNDIRSKFEDEPVQRIYGGIHLLRLFVKLGPLLSYSPNMTEEDTIRRLRFYFEDLLQFLLVKKSEYFGIEHYENASEEYLRRVQ